MKYLTLFALLLFSCNRSKETDKVVVRDSITEKKAPIPEIPSGYLIEPGVRIGHIELNSDAEKLDSLLGKPDFSDAAMGKAWVSWYGKNTDGGKQQELNVYTTYENNELMKKVVRLVRVTSSQFQTSHGLRTGDSFEKIQKAFPDIVHLGDYNASTPEPVLMYDEVQSGIAFEFQNDTCIAITIHPKGRKVTDDYITLHPDMKLL